MVNCPEYISDFQLTESNFHRLYLDYYPSLILYARRILKEEEGWAEDLVQDVFIRTWEANREIREAGKYRDLSVPGCQVPLSE